MKLLTTHMGAGRNSRLKWRAGAGGLFTVLSAAALATACNAADSVASANLTPQQMVDRAVAGQTIVLPAAGGVLNIRDRKFAKPVTIDLSRARLSAINVRASSGIRLVNGTITGNGERNTFGILIQDSQKLEVSRVTVTNASAGIGLQRSQDILIANNNLTGLIADGVMIGGSQRVKVYYNSCSNFNPMPKTYDANGTLLRDGDHPDCIQAWSIKGYAPVSDLEIVGNRGYGNFQGIFLNNNVINGVSDGGYDRVTVTGNDMQVAWYNGIYVADGRGVRITGNRVSTVPGSRDIRGLVYDRPIRSYISVIRGSNVLACGNIVVDFPTSLGTAGC